MCILYIPVSYLSVYNTVVISNYSPGGDQQLMMNYSEPESAVCDPILSNTWLYPIIAWFLFTFLLSAFSLLYAAVEARKKHIEIEEAYEPSDVSYTDSDYSDDGSYVSSAYVTLPDEYRGKTTSQRRSRGSSGAHSLGQIVEDEEEEESEDVKDSERIKSDDQSSDDSEVEIVESRLTKYKGSISGKGKSNQSQSDESEVDEDQSQLSKYQHFPNSKCSSEGSTPKELSRNSSFTPSISSMPSSLSNTYSECSKETSISQHHHHSRNRLKVPNVRSRSSSSFSPRSSIVRTESQNRADFLLKMMAKGGDYRTYRSRSPDLSVSPKISPTGRKISVDMKPRSSTSYSLSIPNKRPHVIESDDTSKKLDHVYVNLPEIVSDLSNTLTTTSSFENTPSPTEEIADITTTTM